MVTTITSPNQIYSASKLITARVHMITAITYLTLILYISVCFLSAVYTSAYAWVDSCIVNANSTCIQSSSVSSAYKSGLDPVSQGKASKSSIIQKDTPFILPFP